MARRVTPRATYRIQHTPELSFDRLVSHLDYLRDLGVSHVYLSPILQAAPKSQHGYDVVDHSRISEELGGEAGYARLCEALAARRLSQVVDLVPNHMAIGTPENRWWWDVLENGPSSRFASYFDVDWDTSDSHDNRILVPVLGDHSGRVVEAKELRVELNPDSRFVVRYHEQTYPAAPRSLGDLLRAAGERAESHELGFIAAGFERLPELFANDREGMRARHREQVVLHSLLNRALDEPRNRDALLAELELLNGDFDRLDTFIERQNYRLRYWQTGRQELDYRRFFDIDTLVGLRMEDPELFEDTHRLVLGLIDEGHVTGLRLDHIDGLREPRAYLAALRQRAPTAWIVVEKILEPGEKLPQTWPCAGTTGYDFLRRVTGWMVCPDGLDSLSEAEAAFCGTRKGWAEIVRASKREVLSDGLRADVTRLVTLTGLVTGRHRRHRDHSKDALQELIEAFVVHFPVYRTYVSPKDSAPSRTDRTVIETVARKVGESTGLDPELVSWFGDVLLLRHEGELETELAMRFQQLTGPAMAKGLEDTAMYRHLRLLAVNDVGCDPGAPVVTLEQLHAALVDPALRSAMTTTSTHDTKRSEDVRARLVVLSEDPDEWGRAVARWRERARAHGADGVDLETVYAMFQTWVGAWPITLQRMSDYATKFVREANRYTSWTNGDAGYEERVQSLLRGLFEDEELTADVEAYVRRMQDAGLVNGLSQALVKLTGPGVPDIYQGCELWDFSLVDPDNRRPVDFELRARMLRELPEEGSEAAARRVWSNRSTGAPKLWVTREALRVLGRTDGPSSVGGHEGQAGREGSSGQAEGSNGFRPHFQPLFAEGAASDRLLAFVRADLDTTSVTAVGRFSFRNEGWGSTRLELPPGRWCHRFDGQTHEGSIEVASLFLHFPVALLVKEGGR